MEGEANQPRRANRNSLEKTEHKQSRFEKGERAPANRGTPVNKREKKLLRQAERRKKKTSIRHSRRSGTTGASDDEGRLQNRMLSEQLAKEEEEILTAVMRSSVLLDCNENVSVLDEDSDLQRALELSVVSTPSTAPPPVIGQKKSVRRRRGTTDDDEYVPKAGRRREPSTASKRQQPKRRNITAGGEDEALALGLNLSLLDCPMAPFNAEMLQGTEKATRKYRKQRNLSADPPLNRLPDEDDLMEVDSRCLAAALQMSAEEHSQNLTDLEENEKRRLLREQQDEEYQASLAADREKEKLHKEQERQKEEQDQAHERHIAHLLQIKISLPPEPEEGTDSVTVGFRLPSGIRVSRRFDLRQPLQVVHAFVCTLALEHEVPARFCFVVDFPRRNTELVEAQWGISLRELGFGARDLVNVVAQVE